MIARNEWEGGDSRVCMVPLPTRQAIYHGDLATGSDGGGDEAAAAEGLVVGMGEEREHDRQPTAAEPAGCSPGYFAAPTDYFARFEAR